ncbi:MAG: DUF393 domain-containing protein [Candidatus Thermoplasmatota archaeon]|nr:DUF393 domain-containing protein [Candidatus Thermoplasmatota archaeon]MCL5785199.1 DUF393 domain-containing protein [Candidatus Thermoplasmatota archaeon]
MKNPQKVTVLYDDNCSVCSLSVDVASKLGGNGTLQFTGIHAQDVADFGISEENLEKSMHTIWLDGRVENGMESLVQITRMIPPLFPFWAFFKLSMLIGFGDGLYDFMARNRHRIGRTGKLMRT